MNIIRTNFLNDISNSNAQEISLNSKERLCIDSFIDIRDGRGSILQRWPTRSTDGSVSRFSCRVMLHEFIKNEIIIRRLEMN